MKQSPKVRVVRILEPEGVDSRVFVFFILTLISLNVIAFALATIPAIDNKYGEIFQAFELFSVAVFSIEYVLRVWSCTINERFKAPILGRIRYILTPLLLIDLIAILPFYLPMMLPNLIFIRGFRLLKLFRILKVARYSEATTTLVKVIRQKSGFIVVLFLTNLIMLIIASGLIFEFEHKAQPGVFSDMFSSLWFTIETFTLIGYGDIVVKTAGGKAVAFIILTIGAEMYLIPAGVIAAGLVEEFETKKDKSMICPHCGKHIDTYDEKKIN